MLSSVSTILLFPLFALANLSCRPDGPVTPRPTNLGQCESFRQVADNLTSIFNKAVAGELRAGWAVENTSFSLGLITFDQDDPGVPIWEHHHLAGGNVDGTKHIGRDSQYLIGSISKVFADLALLKSGLNLDDAVTNFLPALANSSSKIQWEKISLRSLGDHLSGISSSYGFAEFAFLGELFRSLGFPEVSPSDFPTCGVPGVSEGCTKQTLLDGLPSALPINAVNEKPAYSNLAFTLLALAVEEATGKNFSSQINDLIADPLGLKATAPSPGSSAAAVIPPVENSWGSDYGLNSPAGGLVSTLSDLSRFAHSILSRSILSHAETRAWLKPSSLTGSLHSQVGLPWEIYRPEGILPDHPSYAATIYAKSGGAYGYRAQLALLDSHGVALVLLTAGDMSALPYIYDAMLSAFVPAIDDASRAQARRDLAMSFSSPSCTAVQENGKQDNSCVKAALSLDDSFKLTSLTRNEKNILAGLEIIWNSTIGLQLSPIEPVFRLYPTEDVRSSRLADGRNVLLEAWRVWLTPVWNDPSSSDLPGQGLWSGDCVSWTLSDWIHYGGEPVDRVLIVRDEETRGVIGLEVPFLRSGMLLANEWTRHQRQAIDPSEVFDMRLWNATIPPAPPPASPEPAYALDGDSNIGGVEVKGEGQSSEGAFNGTDLRDVRYITSRPDVVDVELDGSHTLRPASSNEYMPPPEPNSTRVLMWQIDFEPDDIDNRSMSERGADIKHWDSMGPTYTTPVAGKLLYHVDNTDRPVQEFFASPLARPYDVWDLQRLWDMEALSERHRVRPFMVQTNMLSEGLNVPFHWYREDRQAMTMSEELRFGNDTITFWQSRTVVTSVVKEDTASVNIEFDGLPVCFEKRPRGLREIITPLVPSEVAGDSSSDVRRIGMRDEHGMQTKAFSPLKDHFLRVLMSSSAASSIEHESPEMAIKLIMLDLLRAVIECWAVFAWQLVHEANEVTDNIDAQSRLHNVRVWQGLQSAPRDIRLATEYLVRSVERDLLPAGRRELDSIMVEMDARIRSIDNRINDIAACVSDLSSTRTAVTQEEQALSVKRLTLLAAVFLPLSLASSLLSMGTRAVDLGVLWYDYLGISVLLVFLAYLAYQTLRAWDMGMTRWKKMLAKLLVGSLDEEAIRHKPKFKMGGRRTWCVTMPWV
ncbi:hypothetical protein F5X68DRAFT_258917 [Plectosphaerella plurivora]|uniref:Beta-lactamase-related domain-containing protein n=1 Tax=Plectosphaerella plurivora TaxID=936078 RepID=A0A9P8VJ54_9PEZI|nr:hypothetical protein F5X68DRAFT_258917 [Plectosphaerella plurivora]